MCGSFATHTPPLDSRLRGNDEFGGGNHSSRIGVRDMLSYPAQSFRLATISSMAARMVRVLSRDSGNS